MSIDYKKYREESPQKGKENKSYVTMTPFIALDMEVRKRANIYSALDYSKEECLSKIDTDAAVHFINVMSQTIKANCSAKGETILWTTFIIELGYFVDSHLRPKKGSRKQEGIQDEDVLDGINCVTIHYPASDGEYFVRRTFIVDLNDFTEKLERSGYETDLGTYDAPAQDAKQVFVSSNMEKSLWFSVIKDYEIDKDKGTL